MVKRLLAALIFLMVPIRSLLVLGSIFLCFACFILYSFVREDSIYYKYKDVEFETNVFKTVSKKVCLDDKKCEISGIFLNPENDNDFVTLFGEEVLFHDIPKENGCTTLEDETFCCRNNMAVMMVKIKDDQEQVKINAEALFLAERTFKRKEKFGKRVFYAIIQDVNKESLIALKDKIMKFFEDEEKNT